MSSPTRPPSVDQAGNPDVTPVGVNDEWEPTSEIAQGSRGVVHVQQRGPVASGIGGDAAALGESNRNGQGLQHPGSAGERDGWDHGPGRIPEVPQTGHELLRYAGCVSDVDDLAGRHSVLQDR